MHRTQQKSKLQCARCMNLSKDPVYPGQCGDNLCKSCWKRFVMKTKICPKCKQESLFRGNQPMGYTTWRAESHNSLPGYEEFGTLVITYHFDKGIQGPEHPNPGQPYCGLFCTSYLPDNQAGKELCNLLRKAFDERLLFTIGKSPATGEEDKIVWNGIELKTSRSGGPANYGYPDPSYIDRAKSQLAEKGITQRQVEETVMKLSHRLEGLTSKLQRLVPDDSPEITERVTKQLRKARSVCNESEGRLKNEMLARQKEETAVGEQQRLLQEDHQQKTTFEARQTSLELQMQTETNRCLSTERERTRLEEELSQARSAYEELEERMQNELVRICQTLDDEIRLRDTRERKLREKETLVDQLQKTLGKEQQERTRLGERLQNEMQSSQSRQGELQTKEIAIREQQRLLVEEHQEKITLKARLRNLEIQLEEEKNRHLSTERERTRVEEELSQTRSSYIKLEERIQNELARIRGKLDDEVQLCDTEDREQTEKETLVDQLLKTLGEEQQKRTRLEERLQNEMLSSQSRQEELQTKENTIREQQRLLEEERQQKTTLEARLRNLEYQIEEVRNGHLSTVIEVDPALGCQTRDWTIQREEVVLSENVLGRGGWGKVCEGTFRSCQVAVKEIHELILSPHNRRLFEREMSIASCCRHPNLLQFIGATNDDGIPLFVTELLDTSLRHMLSQRALKQEEIVSLALDVAKGLNYLHLNKPLPIIHRDVSSANVLLWRRDECWRAKLSDYGAANFMRQCMTVNPGAIIYSAPEALTSNQSPKVDVYSFGVLFCEMCIRELPVPQGIHNQIRQVTDGALRQLILRCVHRDTETRAAMSEVIRELDVHRDPETRPAMREEISELEGSTRTKGMRSLLRTLFRK